MTLLSFLFFIFLFLYTPLQEYIPGKTTQETKKELISLALKADSLEVLLNNTSLYIENMSSLIKDDFSFSEINFNYIIKKIDKFYKNKKLRNNSSQVGGLGNINLEEY